MIIVRAGKKTTCMHDQLMTFVPPRRCFASEIRYCALLDNRATRDYIAAGRSPHATGASQAFDGRPQRNTDGGDTVMPANIQQGTFMTFETVGIIGAGTMGAGIATSLAAEGVSVVLVDQSQDCLLYTSPSPRDRQKSRMPSSA